MNKENHYHVGAVYELQQKVAHYENAAAYKKLLFHFFLPLKSFSFSILKSKEYAEEIVSDVFVEIWAKRKPLMDIENLKIYLYISVRNAWLKKTSKPKNAYSFVKRNSNNQKYVGYSKN